MSQATRALAHAFETGALAERRAFFLRAEDPPFTIKQMVVSAAWPGATARGVEEQPA